MRLATIPSSAGSDAPYYYKGMRAILRTTRKKEKKKENEEHRRRDEENQKDPFSVISVVLCDLCEKRR
jgi:hypothetical protein